ncbi:MAG: hypothetical protein IJZ30_03255 [Alphaproteobacteria bacterium]|nr:hypothetical protein [Alphaproteobacteria bacterium]
MKKSLKLALFLTVSLQALAYAQNLPQDDSSLIDSSQTTSNYTLDENTISQYQLDTKEEIIPSTEQKEKTEATNTITQNTPQIVKEEIKGGYIEKLVNDDGLVIAEKKVIKGNIVERVLNEYHPNKKIARKIISTNNDGGFYAEEYYTNGKIASEATYINDTNKLGVEKKYDVNGVLRQEIPWEEVRVADEDNRLTKVSGRVKTYYPNGKIAASFIVGKKGNNIFYNKKGKVIKKISNVEILNFSKELQKEDCDDYVVELSIKDLVSLYEDEGDISYNKCGLPYKEIFVYEVITSNDKAGLKLSFDEKGMLRRTTPYSNGFKNGIERKYDASGNLTAEIPYKKGIKDGFANGYFPTREVAFRKRYEDGKVIGNLTCYFPTGEVAAEIPYKNGLKEGFATIQSPVKKELEFKNGELVGDNAPKQRIITSILDDLKNKDKKCLNINTKYTNILQDIEQQVDEVKSNLTLDIPESCSDMNNFKREISRYSCYENNILRGTFPPAYNKQLFAKLQYYNDASRVNFDIPYNQTLRQGFARKFDDKQNMLIELNYDKGELTSSSRSYYENGVVKNLLVIEDNKKDFLLNSYNEEGNLVFNLSYKDGKKEQAYISKNKQNKDIYVKYYDGELDNIREVNKENPLNYIEYNLASNEYGVYKDGQLIKGGDICQYDNANTIKVDFMPSDIDKKDNKKSKDLTQQEAKILQEEIEKLDANMDEIKANDDKENKKEILTEKQTSLETKDSNVYEVNMDDIPPVIDEQDAPIVEGLEDLDTLVEEIRTNTTENITKDNEENKAIQQTVEVKENIKEGLKQETYTEPKNYNVENAIIPTIEEKEAQLLAAQNIGPIAKPDIDNLSDVVSKQTVTIEANTNNDEEVSNTEKFYYPNGNLRKTIKTKGRRTEEIKEYSKNGLLLTDTIYNDDGILIEKYYGSGEVRRKTNKDYSDNAITSFISRIDFYNTGKPRYEIERKKETLLFNDKDYDSKGKLIKQTIQTSPLSYIITEYDSNAKTEKQTTIMGENTLIKEYKDGNLENLKLNGKTMPKTFADKSEALLKDNAKTFGTGGAIVSEFKYDDTSNILYEYYPSSKVKTEIVFYNNGEISIKSYTKDSELEKFAYLSTDGKLYIQKPEVRTIPSYRERYWVDYNNPNWIENTDKYSVKSIARLTLDTTAYILNELEIEIPDILRRIYELY